MMYMKISLSDFMTVFAARTRAPFYSRAPGGLLLAAATFALGCSTLLSAYWPFPELRPLEWSLLGYVRSDQHCWLTLHLLLPAMLQLSN